MNRTFKRERQKINSHLLLCSGDHYDFFSRDSHHEWAFVGGPTTSPNKSFTYTRCGARADIYIFMLQVRDVFVFVMNIGVDFC